MISINSAHLSGTFEISAIQLADTTVTKCLIHVIWAQPVNAGMYSVLVQ
jgi:hypothetical protein